VLRVARHGRFQCGGRGCEPPGGLGGEGIRGGELQVLLESRVCKRVRIAASADRSCARRPGCFDQLCFFVELSLEGGRKKGWGEREKYHNHGCSLKPLLPRLGYRQSGMYELTGDSDIWGVYLPTHEWDWTFSTHRSIRESKAKKSKWHNLMMAKFYLRKLLSERAPASSLQSIKRSVLPGEFYIDMFPSSPL